MKRAVNKTDRRAMADALRHMHQSGARFTDLRHGSGATHDQVVRSLGCIFLPGRDGIIGAVSPRHVDSLAGEVVPPSNLAGRDGTDYPVAPAPFPGGAQGGNGFEQSWADVVIVDRDLLHADSVSRRNRGRHPVMVRGGTP